MERMPVELEARLRAIEFLIVNLYGIENRRRQWDAQRIQQEHDELLARMRQQERRRRSGQGGTASEVYRQMERLLSDIRAIS